MKKRIKYLIICIIPILIIIGLFLGPSLNKKLTRYINKNSKATIKNSNKKEKLLAGIFEDNAEEAKSLLNTMTLEEKVGQLFLVRYNKSDVERFSSYSPGGYILFAKDFQNHNKETIKASLESNQSISKFPLILGVDEEGGYVTRISRYKAFRSTKFLSPKYYYEKGGISLLEQIETEKASLLKEIGINLNLAPVADVSTNSNDFIYNRTFGYDAQSTSNLIAKMVTIANNNQINSCLKHFPGYGNNKDTHTGVAVDNRNYENFVENDFKPFEAGISSGVPSILVSHNIVNSMDSELPASLSSKVIKILRDDLKFTGIIMTDDLAMDAVKSYVTDKKAATLAIKAGNDMIITSDFLNMYNEVLESVKNNEISKDTIDKAVLRILAWKYHSNLFT